MKRGYRAKLNLFEDAIRCVKELDEAMSELKGICSDSKLECESYISTANENALTNGTSVQDELSKILYSMRENNEL